MKLTLTLILLAAFVSVCVVAVAAQENSRAAQAAEDLRAQLLDVQAKESELQAREQRLDEDLKPGNIERSLAGIGSTRPEELREQRRRQLSIERESVRNQLRLLATSRERLESAIRSAEARAYQQSAQGISQPVGQTLMARYAAGPGWLIGMLGGLVAIVGIVVMIVVLRRANAG